MTRFPFVFLAAALAGPASAADPDPRSPPDLFGRPRPHGPVVENAFLGLYAGRTDLLFGQPMRVELFTVDPGGPYLDLPADAAPELTDAAGKAVPFHIEGRRQRDRTDVAQGDFILWPTKDHAVGVYWKPGTYKLKLTVVIPNEQPPAKRVVTGTFRSNELTFTVREPGAAPDKWNGKGKTVPALTEHMFLYAAGLDDESSERLRKRNWEDGFNTGPVDPVRWRLLTAEFAPISVPQDRNLTEAEAKKLLADLKDKNPATRVRAVRSVSPTAPADVFAAVVELLHDTHEQPGGPFSHGPTYPITYLAADALVRLGAAAVEPLIAFAEKNGKAPTTFHEPARRAAAGVLGRIGPNPSAEKYLSAAIASGDDDRVGCALVTATAWGKSGIGLARTVLALPKLPDGTRRAALNAVGQFGDLKTDGPAARKWLADSEPKFQDSAIKALLELRDAESVPAFERIARDPKADVMTRLSAAHATLALADTKTGDRLVRDLIASKDGADVDLRYYGIEQAGRRKVMAVLPLVLDALDDTEEPTRFAADRALRALADRPDGVGYDGRNPDAKRWREFLAKREK